MADIITVTVPDLPAISQTTGDELVAVWKGDRLSRIPQSALRGSRLFTGATAPPDEPSVIMLLSPMLGDRWRNTATSDEWKVTSLDPFVWTPDGNVGGADGAPSTVPGPPGVGQKGDKGDAGNIFQRTASVTIPASTVVISDSPTSCRPANSTNAAHVGKVIGVVADATAAGSLATIKTLGPLTGIGGSFSAGNALFVSATGTLTNVASTAGWYQQIGTAETASSILINLGNASLISDDGPPLVLAGGGSVPHASSAQVIAGASDVWIDPGQAQGVINEAVEGFDTALAGKQATSAKGQASGYAPLDGTGKLPVAHLSDDVARTPATEAEAYAGSSSTLWMATLRVRQMLERYGCIQFGRFGMVPNVDSNAARTANSQATADAIDLVLSVGRGIIEMPGADLHMGPKTTRTFTPSEAGKTIGFRGQGDATRIICAAAAGSHGWLDLFSTNHFATFGIRDLVGVPKGACTGVFARLDMQYGGARQDTTARCYGVTVVPFGVNTPDYFAGGGISLGGSWNADISGNYITGPYGVDIWNNLTDSSPQFAMGAGLLLNDAYGYFGYRNFIACANIGVSDQSTVAIGGPGQPATQPEGGTFDVFRIVNVRRGFVHRRTSGVSGEEEFKIGRGHINARDINLTIDGASQFNVGEILFYNDAGKASGSAPTDILLTNVSRGEVVQPRFYGVGPNADTRRNNIVIDAATCAQFLDILGPKFESVGNLGVWVLPGLNARDIRMLDHKQYPAPSTVTTLSLDQSSPASLTIATR